MASKIIDGVKQILDSPNKQDNLLAVLSLRALVLDKEFNNSQLEYLFKMLLDFCNRFTIQEKVEIIDWGGNNRVTWHSHSPFIHAYNKYMHPIRRGRVNKKIASKITAYSRVRYILNYIYSQYIKISNNPEEFRI